MNSTRAVEVSIQAVSPELIFDESTENGAVGAAGAASDAAAAADASAGALAAGAAEASAAGALAAASDAAGALAVVSGAEAAAGADASSARAAPMPTVSSEPAISRDINNLRIFSFLLSLFFTVRPRRSRRCESESPVRSA